MKATISALFKANGRVSYRRFLCFITATVALFVGSGELITAEQWGMVCAAYIGGDSLEAMVGKWKSPQGG